VNIKKREIPVIFFCQESGKWEPSDEKNRFSRLASTYKNQVEAAERQSLLDAAASGELYALRNERRRAALAERAIENKKKKKRTSRDFMVFMMIAAVFLVLLMYMQR